MSFDFKVEGVPIQKGSKSGFLIGGKVRIVDQKSKALKGWNANVRAAAQSCEMKRYEGPVYVSIDFYMPRPSNHFGTGRNEGKLKRWAMMLLPDVKPDLDKLTRTIFDALTGTCYMDDAQVVRSTVQKFYEYPPGKPIGVEVRIIAIVATGNSQRERNG